MPYCAKQDLIDRFSEQELIQLTDDANLGVINDAALNKAISDADAEINGYLTTYSLPLVTVPANLVLIACNLTRYHLYGDTVTELVQTRYDAAIKYLTQVAKGVITLGPDVTGTVVATTSNSVEFSSSPSLFGRNDY